MTQPDKASAALVLDVAHGTVVAVRQAKKRPLVTERLLLGKSPSEASNLARLVFSICPEAQSGAIAMACAAASGRHEDLNTLPEALWLEALEGQIRRWALTVMPALGAPEQIACAREAIAARLNGDRQALMAVAERLATAAAPWLPEPADTDARAIGEHWVDPTYQPDEDLLALMANMLWDGPSLQRDPPLPAVPVAIDPSDFVAARLRQSAAWLAYPELPTPIALQTDDGAGVVAMPTSRGPLLLAVRLDDKCNIAGTRSLAPSEWALSPAMADGPPMMD